MELATQSVGGRGRDDMGKDERAIGEEAVMIRGVGDDNVHAYDNHGRGRR